LSQLVVEGQPSRAEEEAIFER